MTGGGGFIGGHLAVALVAAGANVRALCRYNSRGDRGTLDWFDGNQTAEIEVVLGELRDPESVQQAMVGIEIAFHLGAQIAIPYSYVNPRDFVMTNVVGTLNVAQAARQADVQRLVQMSTSEVYGEPPTWPITPEHPLNPRSPYAASKASADLLVNSLHASFDLPVVIARAFNTYGPHQSARAIVPTIITQALQDDRIRLGALEPRRDLTFVTDTVAGLMAIATAAPNPDNEPLHLGSGRDVSIADLVAVIGELTGRELQVELDPRRVRPVDSEVSRLLCDYSGTQSLTGWAPSVDLRDGLARTLASIRRHQHRYRAGEYAT